MPINVNFFEGRVPDQKLSGQLVAPAVTSVGVSMVPALPGRYLLRWRLSNLAGEANVGSYQSAMAADAFGVQFFSTPTPSEGFEFSTVSLADIVANHAWTVRNELVGGAGVAYHYDLQAWFLSS